MTRARAAAGRNTRSAAGNRGRLRRRLRMRSRLRNVVLAMLTGVIGFLAFPPADLSILAWVFLVPLFFVLKQDMSYRDAFLYSFLCGVVLFSGILYWLPNVTVPGTIILILIMAAYIGAFGTVARMAFRNSMDPLVLPFIWVVLEFLRGHLLTGFPWALLGYTQYTNTSLIQIADTTGAYGVSFLVCAFNVAVFAVATRAKRRIACMMTVLIFIIAATTYGISRTEQFSPARKARLSVVQGNIPQDEKWSRGTAEGIIGVYTRLTEQAAGDAPDMVIWPETAYPYLVQRGDAVPQEISDLALSVNTPILAGIVSSDNGFLYNSALLFGGNGQLEGKYSKTHLVPFGEYVPGLFNALRDHIDKPIGDFKRGGEYTLLPLRAVESSVAADGSLSRIVNFYKFGVLICFEDVFPYISREFVSRGASFLVNITNDAWFGDTAAPIQHLQASVFRAVENRVPVVRAANTGISAFIDPLGRITSILEDNGRSVNVEGYLTDRITISPVRALYSLYGDIFVYFCGVMVILLFILESLIYSPEHSLQKP